MGSTALLRLLSACLALANVRVWECGEGCVCRPAPPAFCCCAGDGLTRDGLRGSLQAFNRTLSKLMLRRMPFELIDRDFFIGLESLEIIDIHGAENLKKIDAEAFRILPNLIKLSIRGAPLLGRLDGTLLIGERLKKLSLRETGLRRVPALADPHSSAVASAEIDLSRNEITAVHGRDFEHLKLNFLDLSFNRIEVTEARAFHHCHLNRLVLSKNPLREMDEDSLSNTTVRALELSGTLLRRLPESGLGALKELHLTVTLPSLPRARASWTVPGFQDTAGLKQLPPIMVFQSLKVARLHYPFHCCLLHKAAPVWRSRESQLYVRPNMAELKQRYCQGGVDSSVGPSTRATRSPATTGNYPIPPPRLRRAPSSQPPRNRKAPRLLLELRSGLKPLSAGGFQPLSKEELERVARLRNQTHRRRGSWAPLPKSKEDETAEYAWGDEPAEVGKVIVSPSVCEDRVMEGIAAQYRLVDCTPGPDALNPCEDLLGHVLVHVFSWAVGLLAVVGNVVVLTVLVVAERPKLRVHYFLMRNLAFADLCAGLYILTLAIEDSISSGEYYNYAVEWQTGLWCRLAGFLAVFSSELSVLSMLLLSFEVWYNTLYGIYGRSVSLGWAVRLTGAAWAFAAAMAALPLLGVSSYEATSTCLPLHVASGRDRAYLVGGLLFNLLCFLGIVVCYVSIYRAVTRGYTTRNRTPEDVAIAKKMAALIVTDALCWAPIIFLGLTAALDSPLVNISTAKVFLVVFYPINACANPWLYVFLTSQFRKDMHRLGRKHPWLRRAIPMTQSNPANFTGSAATLGRGSLTPGGTLTTRPSLQGSSNTLRTAASDSLPRVRDPLRRPGHSGPRLSVPSLGNAGEEGLGGGRESLSLQDLAKRGSAGSKEDDADLQRQEASGGAESRRFASGLRRAFVGARAMSAIKEASENSHSSNSHSGGDGLAPEEVPLNKADEQRSEGLRRAFVGARAMSAIKEASENSHSSNSHSGGDGLAPEEVPLNKADEQRSEGLRRAFVGARAMSAIKEASENSHSSNSHSGGDGLAPEEVPLNKADEQRSEGLRRAFVGARAMSAIKEASENSHSSNSHSGGDGLAPEEVPLNKADEQRSEGLRRAFVGARAMSAIKEASENSHSSNSHSGGDGLAPEEVPLNKADEQRSEGLRRAFVGARAMSAIKEASENSHSSNSHSGGDGLAPEEVPLNKADEQRLYAEGPSTLRRGSGDGSSVASSSSLQPRTYSSLSARLFSRSDSNRRQSGDSGYPSTPKQESKFVFPSDPAVDETAEAEL